MFCAVVYLCAVAMVMLSQTARVQGMVAYSRSEVTDIMSETVIDGAAANKIYEGSNEGKKYSVDEIINTETDPNNKPMYSGKRPHHKHVKKIPIPTPQPENSTT